MLLWGLWWGSFGPGASGPQAMDAVVQRTAAVVTGLLALGSFLAPLLRGISSRRPHLTWVLIWLGCTTAGLQAPTQVLSAGISPTSASPGEVDIHVDLLDPKRSDHLQHPRTRSAP